MRPTAILLLPLASIGISATSLQAQQPARLSQFLRNSIHLDASQLASVERGEPLARTLDTQNPRDVAVFGIIATSASRASVVQTLKDFPTWLATTTRVRFGIFSDPAAVADVRALLIDAKDAEDAKKCRPGDCTFKLPGAEMARIKSDIDWSARDMQAQLSAYARQRLVAYVTDYRTRGDSALVVYDDRGGVRASDAFAALLAESPYLYEYAPAIAKYLRGYPRQALDSSTEVIFWSEDAMPRLRRTLNVNHLVVYSPPDVPMTIVASKQIYAKHYFEAALDLMSVIDREGTSGASGSYLVVLRRYRFDNLPSGGLLNIKGRVLSSLREKMLVDLAREKALAERARE
jgi:hypothetical protein